MKKIIAANWKQNGSLKLLTKLTRDLKTGIDKLKNKPKIILFPPSIYLDSISEELKKNKYSNKNIQLGIQNVSPYENGAYTGEISIDMVSDFNCPYVLIGHSERRHIFRESEDLISKKLNKAFQKNKKVILCVGETLKDYRDKNTKRIITKQIKSALRESLQIIKKNKRNLIVAYEPVWAIGTGRSAKIQDIETTHILIRELITKLINDSKSEIKILYGGSVSPQNSKEILRAQNVDGALVGGASLSAKKFIEICRAI
tara:strand:+ start:934 stop:1707 length:774 start_codon:yes stop_codon:yes gene_type:complete